MPDFFHVISEYFWVVALAFTAFNYWRAGRDAGAQEAPEARTYLRRFAAASALPWVVMGVGQITGATPTVWHYFRPQDGNVFVLAWLATAFALTCAFAWWVFLAGGAQKFIQFNLMALLGQRGSTPPSENMIKFFAAVGLLVFPIWVYVAILMNAPLPR